MTMRPILALFALVAVAPASRSVAATCPRQPRTAAGVLAAEHAWVKAIEHRNVAALSCTLDRTFADSDWRGGRVPRAEMLERLPQHPPAQLHLSEVQVTVAGAMAMVRGINTQTAGDGTTVGSVRFTDLFVYRDDAWRAIAAQETLILSPAASSQTAH
jgi:ketosteroid isomerase-like protein